MRDNNVPRVDRLRKRVDGLVFKLRSYSKPIGGGNIYSKCRHCGISMPQLYTPDGRHFKGCVVPGWGKELVYFGNLLLNAEGIFDLQKREDIIDNRWYSVLSGSGLGYLISKD